MIEDGGDANEATKKILDFAGKHGLNTNPGMVNGKVIEFLMRFRPEHYKALLDAGVL
jgi:hypothetical protein